MHFLTPTNPYQPDDTMTEEIQKEAEAGAALLMEKKMKRSSSTCAVENTRVSTKKFQKKMRYALVITLLITTFSGCIEQSPASPEPEPPMTPGSTVTGCVTADDGTSIPDVEVAFFSQKTLTDENGCFSFEGVSPGTGTLSVRKEGFAEVIVLVEARADVSVDTGTIILPQASGDIVRVEELPREEYVPGPDADTLIHYYIDMGFDEEGSVRVEYAQGTTVVTGLTTSTSSAFVFENNGAAGILFDFSEELKEIRVGDIVLVGSFGAEIEEYVFILPLQEDSAENEESQIFFGNYFGLHHNTPGLSTEMQMNHPVLRIGADTKGILAGVRDKNGLGLPNVEDEKKLYQIFFNKKMEKPAASVFNKRIMSIREDLVHPDLIRNLRGLVNILVSVPSGFQGLIAAVSGYSAVAWELCEAFREAVKEMKDHLKSEWMSLVNEEMKYIEKAELKEDLKKVYEELLQKKIEEREVLISQGGGCEGSEVREIEK